MSWKCLFKHKWHVITIKHLTEQYMLYSRNGQYTEIIVECKRCGVHDSWFKAGWWTKEEMWGGVR